MEEDEKNTQNRFVISEEHLVELYRSLHEFKTETKE